MDNKIRITRQQLYDKVWSMPMSKLAKEIGLSDVGLAKICKRHGIPRPSAGYWLRARHGQNLGKEPLPEAGPGESVEIEFTVVTNAEAFIDEDVRAELDRIQQSTAVFSVDQSGTLKHPLLVELQKIRRGLHPDADKRVSGNRSTYLDINVSPGSWDRALRIMDTVLRAAEQLGYSVRAEERTGTVMKVLGEDVPIGLKEKILASEAPPPDRSDGKYHPLGKTYQYTSTGLLTLSIKNLYLDGGRVNWSDTNRARLEEKIGEFLEGVIVAVVRLRARNAKWDEEERQRKEAARIRQEREKQEQLARERVQGLIKDAESWHRALMLRTYVAARETAAGVFPSKEMLEWLEWAKKYADSIDPLLRTREKPERNNPVAP